MAAKKNTGLVRKERKMEQKTRKELMEETYGKVEIHQLINFDVVPEKKVKVSIIIPVYNVAQYLRECLESAVNQTLQEIEIICVNDGSTDGSLDILKEYAQRDNRVKVIDKENAGYGHTMNLGMDMAMGEYIGIVESDDYVKVAMFETLYNIAISENIDMVKADYYRFTVDGECLHLFYHMLTDKEDLYNRVIYGADDLDMFKFTNTWSGIYKKGFLDKNVIRHQETPGASYQDNGFWFLTTVCAESIYYLDRPFYMNRRDNPDSSVYQKGKVEMANNEYAYIYRFLDQKPELKEKYKKFFYVKKFDNYYYCYRQIDSELKKEYLLKFSKEFSKDFCEIDRDAFDLSAYRALCHIVERPMEYYEETKEIEDISFQMKLKKDDIISIVFICDKGYVVPTATAIASLVKFKGRDTVYDITIIAVNLSDEDIRKFSKMKAQKININIFYIEQNLFADLHYKDITDHGVSTTALIKFLLPDFMRHCDKILYLDGDIIVKRDLMNLYHEDIEGNYAGVVRDIPQVFYERQIFGERYGQEYFNSGVMLLNVKKMREDQMIPLLISTKRNLNSKLMDQDVFNEVFGGKVKQLSIEYNTLYVNLVRSRGKYRLSTINTYYGTNYKKIEDLRRSSSIIHFCSEDKPWKYYDVPMADVWLEHYFRSQYGNKRLIRESCEIRQERSGCNGEIQFYEQEESRLIPFVFHYDCFNKKEILDNILFLNEYLDEDEKSEFYLLYEKQNLLDISWFEKELPADITLKYIEISKIIERDKEYALNGELHAKYYKMLVPEILCQYDRVFIIDGAIIEKEIRFYLHSYDSENIVNYTWKHGFSFWDSPVVMIDVKKFVCNITKFKFFDAYNKGRGNYDFSKAIIDAIPGTKIGGIDSCCFMIEEKSLIDIFNFELSEKNKKMDKILEEYQTVQRELEKQKKYVEQLNYELYMTRTSISCRLGLFLTAIPRKLFRRK